MSQPCPECGGQREIGLMLQAAIRAKASAEHRLAAVCEERELLKQQTRQQTARECVEELKKLKLPAGLDEHTPYSWGDAISRNSVIDGACDAILRKFGIEAK